MIILHNNGHGGIIRVCMGIFTTALRNKKYVKFSKKKNLTLLPQCVACYLTVYFDEKSPFKRVVYFEVSNVHKKSFSYERWKPRNGQLAKMRSFHQSKRSDNKKYGVEVRWGIFLRIWRIFLFLRVVVNIPIQTLIIPPWLLLHKMIISQLELGPPVLQ